MPRTDHSPKMDTFTFRIEADLKAALMKMAATEEKPAGQFLRDLIKELLISKRKNDFAGEAKRQSMIIAAASTRSDSDEAEVLRQLDASFDELSRDWR